MDKWGDTISRLGRPRELQEHSTCVGPFSRPSHVQPQGQHLPDLVTWQAFVEPHGMRKTKTRTGNTKKTSMRLLQGRAVHDDSCTETEGSQRRHECREPAALPRTRRCGKCASGCSSQACRACLPTPEQMQARFYTLDSHSGLWVEKEAGKLGVCRHRTGSKRKHTFFGPLF